MKRKIHKKKKKKKRKKRSISSNDLLLDMNSNVIKEAITDDTNEYKRLMKKGFTKPLYKYKHPKRTVYIHEVEKVAWMKSMDVYYIPNQNKRKNLKDRKDAIIVDKINTVTNC